MDPTHTVRPPLQKRSQRTLERFVGAAQRLLQEKNWSDVSVTELVEAAHSSVGAFYTRFRDKEALLDHLDEIYTRDFIRTFARSEAGGRSQHTLQGKIERLVSDLGRFYRVRRGVARAVVLRARMLRERAYEERTGRMNDILVGVYAGLLEHADEIEHPNAERAVFFVFNLIFFTLRERILFPETIRDRWTYGSRAVEAELVRAAMAYLCPSRYARGDEP